jgi:hypothetical protein
MNGPNNQFSTQLSHENDKAMVQLFKNQPDKTAEAISEKLDAKFSDSIEHELLHSFWTAKLRDLGLETFHTNSIAFEELLYCIYKDPDQKTAVMIDVVNTNPINSQIVYYSIFLQYESLIMELKSTLLKLDPNLQKALDILSRFKGKKISPRLLKYIKSITVSFDSDYTKEIKEATKPIIDKINILGRELNSHQV